ncbi:Thrombospondin-2 [Echinococcus granulosus]|uniref:Thrombospondin-2 n=1 Tax=Echinococcus granulosus TaxID=6210 RepID=W6UI45_ECHGR|nr:Thrombospondin-2 [Echinococcus granulosus]EUB60761.1 Thrombospondin-2 [Echinococcus granulosus]
MRQTKDCGEALGRGECRPFWSSWTSWSACSATCGVSERSRYRPCSGAYTATSTAEVEGSCGDPARAAEGLQKRDCPLQRLCPRIAGGWGEWSAFSACDATCGRGSRRRIRLCNRPPPQGGGVPCQGIDTQQPMPHQTTLSFHQVDKMHNLACSMGKPESAKSDPASIRAVSVQHKAESANMLFETS